MVKEDVICLVGIILIVGLFIFAFVCDMHSPMDACMRTYRDYEYCQLKVGGSECEKRK